MRLKTLLACAILAFSGLIGATTASSAGHAYRTAPAGWGETRTVRHHVYYPRYKHVYHVHSRTDPYRYRPAHRGYYPYYNSGYWRPAHLVRKKRFRYYHRKPRYYRAWGHTKRGYKHRKWHSRHHGRHHWHHW